MEYQTKMEVDLIGLRQARKVVSHNLEDATCVLPSVLCSIRLETERPEDLVK